MDWHLIEIGWNQQQTHKISQISPFIQSDFPVRQVKTIWKVEIGNLPPNTELPTLVRLLTTRMDTEDFSEVELQK